MLSGDCDPKREKRNSNVFCTPKLRRQRGSAQKLKKKIQEQQCPELFESEKREKVFLNTNSRKIETSQNPVAEQ